MNKLFIAPKIKVGYQKRTDTFTGKLAYVIYYDEKGKLRKETSWEGWRDKDIPFDEYENVPTDGFTINKDVKRYNGNWWSSTRTLVRIHDPRGFEFEVTTENLIAILMHTDCLRRGLIGQFVYAWAGKELVLLPTNSEEYQGGIKYTSGLAKKVAAKNLIAGMAYSTKRRGDTIYIGKFDYYSFEENNYYGVSGPRTSKKCHIFTDDNGKSFYTKDSVSFLSQQISDTIVSNYAELVEKYNSHIYAHKITGFEFKKTEFDPTMHGDIVGHNAHLNKPTYFTRNPNDTYSDIYFILNLEWDKTSDKYILKGYVKNRSDYYLGGNYNINTTDTNIVRNERSRDRSSYYGYYRNDDKILQIEDVNKIDLYDLYVTFENGKVNKIEKMTDLASESKLVI